MIRKGNNNNNNNNINKKDFYVKHRPHDQSVKKSENENLNFKADQPKLYSPKPLWKSNYIMLLNLKHDFSVDAQSLLKQEFAYLGDNLSFDNVKTPHPHPVGAFYRRHFEEVIESYRCSQRDWAFNKDEVWPPLWTPKFMLTDIGGNAGRHASYGRELIISACPVIDGRDSLRQQVWKNTSVGSAKVPRYCKCQAWVDGDMSEYVDEDFVSHDVCIEESIARWDLRDPRYSGEVKTLFNRDRYMYSSVDSIYYPGVLQTIVRQVAEGADISYACFNAYPQHECKYSLPENAYGVPEGVVVVTKKKWVEPLNSQAQAFMQQHGDQAFQLVQQHPRDYQIKEGPYVSVSMEGNPAAYEHPVFDWPADRQGGVTYDFCSLDVHRYVYAEELRRVKYGQGAYVLLRFIKVDKPIGVVKKIIQSLTHTQTQFTTLSLPQPIIKHEKCPEIKMYDDCVKFANAATLHPMSTVANEFAHCIVTEDSRKLIAYRGKCYFSDSNNDVNVLESTHTYQVCDTLVSRGVQTLLAAKLTGLSAQSVASKLMSLDFPGNTCPTINKIQQYTDAAVVAVILASKYQMNMNMATTQNRDVITNIAVQSDVHTRRSYVFDRIISWYKNTAPVYRNAVISTLFLGVIFFGLALGVHASYYPSNIHSFFRWTLIFTHVFGFASVLVDPTPGVFIDNYIFGYAISFLLYHLSGIFQLYMFGGGLTGQGVVAFAFDLLNMRPMQLFQYVVMHYSLYEMFYPTKSFDTRAIFQSIGMTVISHLIEHSFMQSVSAQSFDSQVMLVSGLEYLMAILMGLFVIYMIQRKRKPFRIIARSCVPTQHEMRMILPIDSRVKFYYLHPMIKAARDHKEVCRILCDPRPENPMVQKSPIIFGHHVQNVPICFHSCARTMCCATFGRQCLETPKPDVMWLKVFEKWHVDIETPRRKNMLLESDFDVSHQKWYDHLKTIQKREADNAMLNLIDKKVARTYNSHVKTDEKMFTDLEEINGKLCIKFGRPRCITAPHSTMKVSIGPFIYALENVWAQYDCGYCGNKNWSQQSQHIVKYTMCIIDPVLLVADGSNFDTTQHKELLEICDYDLYVCVLDYFGSSIIDDFSIWYPLQELDQMVSVQLKSQLLYRYRIKGTVPSGKNNTTEANTRRMLAYWTFSMYLYCKNNSLMQWKNGVEWFCLVKGDDVIIWITRNHAKAFMDHSLVVFKNLGQVLKNPQVGLPLSHFEFCSTEGFLRGDGSYRFIRVPKRLFQLTSWSISVHPTSCSAVKQLLAFCFSEGQNIMSWALGLPIFDAYARMLMRLGVENSQYVEVEKWVVDREFTDCRADDYSCCLDWLSERYNVTYEDVVSFEKLLAEIVSPFDVVNHSVIDAFNRC